MVVWPQPHGSKGLIGRSRKFVAQYLGLASRFEPYGVELLQVDQYLPVALRSTQSFQQPFECCLQHQCHKADHYVATHMVFRANKHESDIQLASEFTEGVLHLLQALVV